MPKYLVILMSFAALTAALPNCCFELLDYADILTTFPCSFTCEPHQKPFENNCISCFGNMSEMDSGSLGSKGFNIMRPVVACQDIFHKANSKDQKFWGRAVLTWSFPDLPKPSFFLVEVREMQVDKWFFVGMTNMTEVLVENLKFNSEYKFRITPFVIPKWILKPYISNWMYLSVGDTVQSLYLTVVNFQYENNSVQATVKWTAPKEAPCSFLLYWWPVTQYLHSTEKIISLPTDSSPMILSDLLFQTNYSMKLAPIYQSDVQKINAAEIWFVTPSCLTLTRGNFSLCAPGPPLNVSVLWINDTKALVSWSPPDYASPDNLVSDYHLSISEASMNYHTVLRYKESFVVEKDVLNAVISDLRSSVLYVFEVRANSQGGVGPPVAVELDIREPSLEVFESSHIPWHYIIPSSVLAVSAIIIALCINFWHRHRQSKHSGYPSGTADIPDYLLPQLLPSKKIDLHDVIGKGEFGVVHRGVYSHHSEKEIVAVKVFPSESVSRGKLLHEVTVLQLIGRHRNIVGLVGFTLSVDKICLVLEYCPLGNLHTRICKLKRELSVIKKKLSDPKQPLMDTSKGKDEHYGVKVSSYIHQIALGMEYISSHNLVHRDIAARNILLCSERHVKIADFGLASHLAEDMIYCGTREKKMPIRWMAPESLEKCIFSTYSDVWSFGVLVWEIFKFGKVPYSSLNNSAILMYLKSGYRLPKPNASSQYWYDLMLECWHTSPPMRPTFKQLVMKTENILGKLSQYSVVVND